ncbi:thioredoxin-like protein [Hyaloraphidium curvatum]|nr:thioredoxin-like protein [Hyaloraphidium curvatum]
MAARASLSSAVRELRLHLSQTSPGSEGLRNFIKNNYQALKKANPELPILIRESSTVEARIFAEYDRGVERKAIVEGFSEAQINATLEDLAKGAK